MRRHPKIMRQSDAERRAIKAVAERRLPSGRGSPSGCSDNTNLALQARPFSKCLSATAVSRSLWELCTGPVAQPAPPLGPAVRAPGLLLRRRFDRVEERFDQQTVVLQSMQGDLGFMRLQ